MVFEFDDGCSFCSGQKFEANNVVEHIVLEQILTRDLPRSLFQLKRF